MIFVWSSEGGPLQLIGLVIFALQFIIPQIFDLTTSIDVQNGTIDINGIEGIGLPLLWAVSCMVIGLILLAVWVAWEWQAGHDEESGSGASGRAASAASARESPSVSSPTTTGVNPRNNNNNTNDNTHTSIIRRTMNRVNSFLQSLSPSYLMLASGFILPLSMALPVLLNAGGNSLLSNTGTIGVTVLAVAAHVCMAIAAYNVLRGVLAGTANYPGLQRQVRPTRGRRRKYTVAEIADIVRKVPVEEFVSEEDVKNGECSISRMKRMLVNRGESDAAEKCIDRESLVEEISRVRKYNDECAVCSEEYAEGDALRVLPCQHEFHLHCFDRWVYTFATETRADTEPSCPLCKASLTL
mmetsp:Transcript_14544/g.31334  ORF Transcript_14544/g.31334 Transcript_14544/m.31334 type:complete len:355 (+) Transcript_14544:106-1170(+)